MATVSYTLDISTGMLTSALRGPVSADLKRRGQLVLAKARQLAPVRTGKLRASLQMRFVYVGGAPQVQIGSELPYAVYQEMGTGIYAGRGYIYPTRAKYLVFKPKGSSKLVFARRVRGTPALHFLERSIQEAV